MADVEPLAPPAAIDVASPIARFFLEADEVVKRAVSVRVAHLEALPHPDPVMVREDGDAVSIGLRHVIASSLLIRFIFACSLKGD
jgi:hypothetical protein